MAFAHHGSRLVPNRNFEGPDVVHAPVLWGCHIIHLNQQNRSLIVDLEIARVYNARER